MISLETAASFATIYNNVEKYPTMADVAHALGLAYQTVRNRAVEIRRAKQDDETYPALVSRAQWVRPDSPASEHAEKFQDLTPQECIDELVRVANIDPEREVTRNHFRNHSTISDATWNRHFGTFEEFKRQAGLKLTRQQHALERGIAKHASVDHYRRLNVDRADYADKYERPNTNRFKTIVACSDLHDEDVDPFFLRVLIDSIRRIQPDVISLVGDTFDLPEFSKYTVDPRDWDVVGKIRFTHDKILRPMREAAPSAQIDQIEGNHEARMLRQMADATPALRAVLSDLHGFTIGKLLGLDEFEINYIAKADLAAWTKRDFDKELANNYKVYFDTVLCHHFTHARSMGLPGVSGHNHKHEVWSGFSPIYGPYEWHQMGAGHKRKASYTEGEKWHNGFCIINVDTYTKATVFDYVTVSDFAISGGKWYLREPHEMECATSKALLH